MSNSISHTPSGTCFQGIHVLSSTLLEYYSSVAVETLPVQPEFHVPVTLTCASRCQNRRMDEANTGGYSSFYVDIVSAVLIRSLTATAQLLLESSPSVEKKSNFCYLGLTPLNWYYFGRWI